MANGIKNEKDKRQLEAASKNWRREVKERRGSVRVRETKLFEVRRKKINWESSMKRRGESS